MNRVDQLEPVLHALFSMRGTQNMGAHNFRFQGFPTLLQG